MAVKLVIDSASDINEKEAQELGIGMIPMSITFGEEEFLDGVNLLPKQFYEKLTSGNVLPKTSQINVFRFEEEFERYTQNGDEVVMITISSKLSGTYNSACTAAEKFAGKVFVVDSMNACAGERLLGLYALQLINNGMSAKTVAEELNKKKSKINVMAVIGTLEYLKKGGRISATAAFAGKLLAIKPVIAVIDGEVKVIGKAMGYKNGNNLLNKIIEENNGIDFELPYGLIWSGTDDTLLNKYKKDSEYLWQNNVEDMPQFLLGGTIGTHIGPGAVGIAFFEK